MLLFLVLVSPYKEVFVGVVSFMNKISSIFRTACKHFKKTDWPVLNHGLQFTKHRPTSRNKEDGHSFSECHIALLRTSPEARPRGQQQAAAASGNNCFECWWQEVSTLSVEVATKVPHSPVAGEPLQFQGCGFVGHLAVFTIILNNAH